jgi:NAD-dependent deacetylase
MFVLTGAGISAESGIPVFQGTSWRGHSHYELANIEAWERDPQLVWQYYSARRAAARDARPNAAHLALAELERSSASGSLFLCTQNVDGLHEAAGSKKVVHIHGKLFESRCAAGCGQPAAPDRQSYSTEELPRCACGALLRPSVCWFGEQPYELERVYSELERCDVFMAVGTPGRCSRWRVLSRCSRSGGNRRGRFSWGWPSRRTRATSMTSIWAGRRSCCQNFCPHWLTFCKKNEISMQNPSANWALALSLKTLILG